MGVGYCAEPREIQYHAVDYKNTEAIQGLLRFYYQLKEENTFKPNFELVSTMVDIENAIKKSGLTTKQKFVLSLYMKGWTEVEIAEKLQTSQQNVSKHIIYICKKLSNYLTGGSNYGKGKKSKKR